MARLDTESTIKLIINGEQAKASLKEVTLAINAERAALAEMKKEDDPKRYAERAAQIRTLIDTQRAMREEIYATEDANKGFFSDWKKGFDEIKSMASGVTIGNLISDGIQNAWGAIKDFVGSSQKEFEEAEKTQAQLSAVLKSTGGAAGVTEKQLQGYQNTLMAQTGIDDDVIAKGEQMLLTFTNVGSKIYDKALPAIVDMTSAMNQGEVSMEGIQATSIQVGKALNDPINGMTSLRKVGVTFNDQQKEQIKTMQESGNIMGAQTIILNELQKEFGGTAEAIRNTSSGALVAFDTAMGNLKERVGGVVVSIKGFFADALTPLITWLGDTTSESDKLTDAYNKQKSSVDTLQKNTVPLIDRYDELKNKGKLNKTEQAELKTVIGQLSDIIPSAVTQWDKYGNALGINTDKARQFIDVQKALLQYQNKDAISALINERNKITEQRKQLMADLNQKDVIEYSGGGTIGTGTSSTRKKTDAEINETRDKLQGLVMDTKKIDDTIKGLTGSYMDDLDKKTTATATVVKKLSEMTVGELQDRITKLNASLKDTTINSVAYKKITQDIADTEKLLNQTKADTNPNTGVAAAKKVANEVKSILGEYNNLVDQSGKITSNELDKKLTEIENKYKSVITKLKKHGKQAEADSLADQQDKEKALATQEAQKKYRESQKNTSDDYIKGIGSLIDKGFNTQQAGLADDQNAELSGASTEDQRLAIKDKYHQKEQEMELAHLQAMRDLQKSAGKDTTDLDKSIADKRMGYNDTVFTDQKKTAAKEKDLQMARLELAGIVATGLSQIVTAVLGNSKAALAFQKGLAIAELAVNTATAIGAVTAQNAKTSLMPIDYAIKVAAAVVTVIANIANATRILKSAETPALPGIQLPAAKKAKKGMALIPDGPSHDDGGINLINNKTGQVMAEMEGGEPIMILSKETRRNNGDLINKLLFNSMYRNGAQVNTAGISNGIQLAKFGALVTAPGTTGTGAEALPGSAGQYMSMVNMEALMKQMIAAQLAANEKPIVFSNRLYNSQNQKMIDFKDEINA